MAKAKDTGLAGLVRRVEEGERVTICRRDQPVAELVRPVRPVVRRPVFDSIPTEGGLMLEEETLA